MPYFSSKEFRISDDGCIIILKRPKSDDSEDAISKASEIDDSLLYNETNTPQKCSLLSVHPTDSGIGRMIEIGQGAATRVIATPVVKGGNFGRRSPVSRKSHNPSSTHTLPHKNPALNSPSQPPPRSPVSRQSHSPSSPWDIPPEPRASPQDTRSSRSQGVPGSTDMIGNSVSDISSPSGVTGPSPAPGTTANTSSTSSPKSPEQPSSVSSPAGYPDPTPKSGNKASRPSTNSSGGNEENNTLTKMGMRWFKRVFPYPRDRPNNPLRPQGESDKV
ncbi:hypothetical protein AGABI2DRAFT_113543 [Agaricus bisporus var. bisporus H97]|uniref:hypothetical protein n=1 Tax=Agaricus bisporus var. bisporus (strain H97 / ATCC MYA-4626 / FGSC 10389) TaxID=936046 RepID=UPI00029F579D|nr:hypothetical protein AGABI2DRAFT_113543 [Agaricus bisporus var. bisporus H97]EKV50786.1 hypothetical protein AGABI2DRAFT_113543 [Agaricus bisporus var. bisporus H97]